MRHPGKFDWSTAAQGADFGKKMTEHKDTWEATWSQQNVHRCEKELATDLSNNLVSIMSKNGFCWFECFCAICIYCFTFILHVCFLCFAAGSGDERSHCPSLRLVEWSSVIKWVLSPWLPSWKLEITGRAENISIWLVSSFHCVLRNLFYEAKYQIQCQLKCQKFCHFEYQIRCHLQCPTGCQHGCQSKSHPHNFGIRIKDVKASQHTNH